MIDTGEGPEPARAQVRAVIAALTKGELAKGEGDG